MVENKKTKNKIQHGACLRDTEIDLKISQQLKKKSMNNLNNKILVLENNNINTYESIPIFYNK